MFKKAPKCPAHGAYNAYRHTEVRIGAYRCAVEMRAGALYLWGLAHYTTTVIRRVDHSGVQNHGNCLRARGGSGGFRGSPGSVTDVRTAFGILRRLRARASADRKTRTHYFDVSVPINEM